MPKAPQAARGIRPPEHRPARLPAVPPAPTGKCLAIRTIVANFFSVGPDGKMPAMRLGLASRPLTCEDILRPGLTAPRPRRVRRTERQLSGLRCAPMAGGKWFGRRKARAPGHDRPYGAMLEAGRSIWGPSAVGTSHTARY